MHNETKTYKPMNKGTKSIVEIIDELKQTSSRNEKESILKREASVNNEELKYVLFMTYDPSVNFYIKKIPEYQTIRPMYDCVTALNAIEEVICSRFKTGQDAVDYLKMVLSNTEPEEVEIVKSVVKRDLDCGVQEGSINKAFKGLINKPPYMSYTLFNEKIVKNFTLPCFSEVKQDGVYADVIVTNDTIGYVSRAGKPFKFSLPIEVEDKLKNIAKEEYNFISQSYVLHGEFLVLKEDGSGYEDRQTGNGYLNSDETDSERIVFECWDVVSLAKYTKRQTDIPYEIRTKAVSEVVGMVDSVHVRKVEQVVCETTEDLINHFVVCRQRGLEGTVIKQFELPWKDHKTKQGVKLKNQFDCEYIVTGTQPHSKKKDQIGALLVESSCGKVKFKVGSGLNDKQRKEFFLQPENIVGKIVTVRGNDLVSSESKDTFSIFLPRLTEVRVDKTEADDYTKIVESRDSIVELLKQIK